MISSSFLSPALALGHALGPELFQRCSGIVPKPRENAKYLRVRLPPALVPERFRDCSGTTSNPRVKINCTRVRFFPALGSKLSREPQGFSRGDV
jgi:hypothetical protein